MSRYFSRVQVISQEGVPFGYFVGCDAYLDNGQFTVVLRHRHGPDCVAPFQFLSLTLRPSKSSTRKTMKVLFPP